MKLKSNLLTLLAVTVACGFLAQQSVSAKQGATDPIPGTSKGAVKSGGSKTTTPATPTTPTPPPVTPITSGTLTFTSGSAYSGSVCTGNYQIDPYYPTLLDMTLNVSVSSLNVPDGTVLYINVVGTADNLYPLYPYTSNAIVIIGGSGACLEKVFVTAGAGLAGVILTDASGAVVFAGN